MLETLLQPGDTKERCGLVLADETIVELENIAQDPENSFEIDPVTLLSFLEKGGVAATWHTHPTGDPNLSGEDYSGFMAWPELRHFIIGLRKKKTVVKEYKIENGVIIQCD